MAEILSWGKLNSTENDASHENKGFAAIYRRIKFLDLSITGGLVTFLRDTDRKVIVVTSNILKKKQAKYRVTLDLKERVAIFSTGQEHVVLVSETGKVCEWKHSATPSNIPRAFSCLSNIHIVQVACGNSHSVVLANDGQLFTWGQNSSGQLGLGKDKPSFSSPEPLMSLSGIPLAQISAGGDHSFALSLSGAVFSWGRNSAGQLGVGDTDDRHVPVCVKSLNLKKTVFVSCGEDHTAVLTKEGLLFTFGSGRYGQLGHNSLRDELRPRVVAELWGSKVSHIACGRHHTLALVESSNTVYSFGCGEQGQLGNGQQTNQCVPFPVQLPPEYNTDQRVRKITAGGNLSVLFISKKDQVQATLSPCIGTTLLDDKIIENWISHCNSKGWKKNLREIKKMFSSAACINWSFCEKSRDKHYKTSIEDSGLDLSLARLAFEKMAKKDKVLLEVERVVKNYLLPSLSSTSADVEALRVYLILPELLRVLHKQGHGTQLTVALASAIEHLKPESMDVLTSLWIKLPYYYYRTLVKVFHSVSAHFMSLMTNTLCDHWTETLPLLNVLKKLYSINNQRFTMLPENYFLIKELIDFFEMVNQHGLESLNLQRKLFEEMPLLFSDPKHLATLTFLESSDLLTLYPFTLDMKSKCILFMFSQLEYETPCFLFDYMNQLCVKRETVLADTLVFLKTGSYDFYQFLKVKFALEDGIDAGGLLSEFFTLITLEITKDSSITQLFEDSGLFWFSTDSGSSQEDPESSIQYYFGVICGLAFYNHTFMNISFPVALFKKLLKLSPTLSDLEELSPVEARSLKDLLTEEEDVVEDLYLDFTVKGIELIPNGAEIPVTKANRQKYVDLYIDFVFNKSVESQFGNFRKGFSHGNPLYFWNIFKSEELRDLLYGVSKYEWEELQKGATYENCRPSEELIQNFWSVFFELSEENQKKFLTFVYGTDRMPIGGLSNRKLIIVKSNNDDADDRFPSAQTCFNILHLPNYSNIDVLRDKLIHAITYCEVFGQM
ncbi:probable E3 ubiquitin-protein ligase HERC4 [Silurus meridionalis]|uniref:HECT domain-containing protein n=1 Tax=Silurus meridionalis TaxID=175797 RepID=A0A8T0BUM0_SILME|nr:probable E3 ubiquitin-protein ligase HERC4 [Silurus meridionalis]KAF7710123.1 hypothetical protein HF521_008995 [Silurus meridionalis]